jgi:hypothetical protein
MTATREPAIFDLTQLTTCHSTCRQFVTPSSRDIDTTCAPPDYYHHRQHVSHVTLNRHSDPMVHRVHLKILRSGQPSVPWPSDWPLLPLCIWQTAFDSGRYLYNFYFTDTTSISIFVSDTPVRISTGQALCLSCLARSSWKAQLVFIQFCYSNGNISLDSDTVRILFNLFGVQPALTEMSIFG